ncbi:MAG: SURF1 family protein [Rhizobiales bacterium]|nr:SURF1 family protein [Hyphomicrobiales bacterium]
MTGLARHWRTLLASLVGVALLLGLGVWQIERLRWKEALIARMAERQVAAPVPLSLATGDDIDFLRVTVRGHYLGTGDKLLLGSFDGSPAWEVVSPFVTAEGTLILVDRGVVPDDRRAGIAAPAGENEVTGVALSHGSGRGFFTPSPPAAKAGRPNPRKQSVCATSRPAVKRPTWASRRYC